MLKSQEILDEKDRSNETAAALAVRNPARINLAELRLVVAVLPVHDRRAGRLVRALEETRPKTIKFMPAKVQTAKEARKFCQPVLL